MSSQTPTPNPYGAAPQPQVPSSWNHPQQTGEQQSTWSHSQPMASNPEHYGQYGPVPPVNKPKKMGFGKKVLIVVGAIFALLAGLAVLGAVLPEPPSTGAAPTTTQEPEQAPEPTTDAPEPTTAPEPETTAPEPTPEPTVETEPAMTLEQENAIAAAESYLSVLAFSRSGLIDQLEFEGYPNDVATFAVDYLDVDWKEQAAKKAQEYLDTMSFSRQGLIDQLLFEGFSEKQAVYGVDAVGL